MNFSVGLLCVTKYNSFSKSLVVMWFEEDNVSQLNSFRIKANKKKESLINIDNECVNSCSGLYLHIFVLAHNIFRSRAVFDKVIRCCCCFFSISSHFCGAAWQYKYYFIDLTCIVSWKFHFVIDFNSVIRIFAVGLYHRDMSNFRNVVIC